jgi:hypothetical protein
MHGLKSNLLRRREGRTRAVFLLPILIIVVFNTINLDHFFFVYFNLAATPRQAAEYSIQGSATTRQHGLPSADVVNELICEDIHDALLSTANTPTLGCTLALRLHSTREGTSGQMPTCSSYSYGSGAFSTQQPDLALPGLVLNRVALHYEMAEGGSNARKQPRKKLIA